MIVEGKLALQVVLGVLDAERLGRRHRERLQPCCVVSVRVHATSELLQLEQERRLIVRARAAALALGRQRERELVLLELGVHASPGPSVLHWVWTRWA